MARGNINRVAEHPDKLPLGPASPANPPKVSPPKEIENPVFSADRLPEPGQGQGGSGKGKGRALVPSNAGLSSPQGSTRPESSGSRPMQLQHSTPVRQNPSGDFAR